MNALSLSLTSAVILAALALLYAAFWVWWGGNGRPMTADERDALIRALTPENPTAHDLETLAALHTLVAQDDGKSFIMQNLVQHRPKALYPSGHHYNDDARAADQRYGKAILWPLLKNGNVVIFVARRIGSFIEPEQADPWHYVAMVRYRSKRDFLKFAIDSNRNDIFVHKWAAIQKTHVFPVRPLVSLFAVRLTLALLFSSLGQAVVAVWH